MFRPTATSSELYEEIEKTEREIMILQQHLSWVRGLYNNALNEKYYKSMGNMTSSNSNIDS